MRRIAFAALLTLTLQVGVTDGFLQNASVEGTVSRLNGNPIPGVRIQLSDRLAGTTDENGRFSIPDVAPADYSVSVERTGYSLPKRYTRIVGGMKVNPGARVTDFHIEMVAEGSITGRILGLDGAPYPGVRIELLRPAYDLGRERLVNFTLRETLTDDRGMFRAYGLLPGEYYVFVEPPQGIQSFFPGTADLNRALPVMVREGEETIANFQIQAGVSPTISVIAVSPSPGTVTRFGVTVISEETKREPLDSRFFGIDSTKTPSQGEARVKGVGLSTHTLFVSGEGPDGFYFGAMTVKLQNGPVSNVSIPLRRGVEMQGRLTIQGDAASVQLKSAPITLRSTTVPFDSGESEVRARQQESLQSLGAPALSLPLAVSPADSKGAFTLRLPMGRYSVFPPQVGSAYIVDVRQGGQSVLDTGLIVGAEPPQPIEVILSSRGGMVEGVLQNARQQGVGFLTTVLVPVSRPFNFYKTAGTDYRGRFVFADVAPGDYELFAWVSAPNESWTNPGFMRRYSGRGTPVTVSEGGRINGIRVNLIQD